MQKFTIGEEADAAAELERLFELNGFIYRREEGRCRLVFADRGRKWETVCVCRERTVIIYGVYPFPIGPDEAALETLNDLNSQLLMGSFFLSEGQPVFRTSAELFDAYGAYEAIAVALEYNAGVICEFWPRLAKLSPGRDAHPIREGQGPDVS